MRTLEFICFETACIGLGVIMEAFTPLTSLWIWIPVTSLAIIGFIVALLEWNATSAHCFQPRFGPSAKWNGPERGARRDRLASLKSMVAYVRREPYFSKLVVDFENQSVSGEPRIPRSYKDRVFSAAVRIGNWRWLRRCAMVRAIVQRVGKWAGYSIQ